MEGFIRGKNPGIDFVQRIGRGNRHNMIEPYPNLVTALYGGNDGEES